MSPTTTSTQVNGDLKDCIKIWGDELDKVNNALQEAEANTLDAQQVLSNATLWANKLKTYHENIEATNEIAVKISDELKQFRDIIHCQDCDGEDPLCVYTQCTIDASKSLVCLVRDFYRCTDVLKTDLLELITKIDCLNNPEINPKSSKIYACLKELCTKVDAAIATQKETITKVIDVLNCACALSYSLCDECCGLRDLLHDLYCLFNTCSLTGAAQVSRSRQGPTYGEGCEQDTPSCHAVIEPKPLLPLSCDPYYHDTEQQYMTAKSEKMAAEEAYNAARKERDLLRATKKSLQDAKKAAETARSCK